MENKTPLVSIIMGSASDYPTMEAAAKFLDQQNIPFEIIALSAHRTPHEVVEFASHAHERGVKVIIAAAGMAAHLPGVVAALTPLPVIGVPVKSSLEGMDAALAIVAINGALNAAILSLQIIAAGCPDAFKKVQAYKQSLSQKIVKANEELKSIRFENRTN